MTSVSTSRHRYAVELRISGKELLPSEITDKLGIVPTQTRQAGERRSVSSVFGEGMWSFSGPESEWDSLEEGLSVLIEVLSPKRQLISIYARRFDVYWWCAHFQDAFDGGPTFSPELLQRLADFGVALVLNNYIAADQQGGE